VYLKNKCRYTEPLGSEVSLYACRRGYVLDDMSFTWGLTAASMSRAQVPPCNDEYISAYGSRPARSRDVLGGCISQLRHDNPAMNTRLQLHPASIIRFSFEYRSAGVAVHRLDRSIVPGTFHAAFAKKLPCPWVDVGTHWWVKEGNHGEQALQSR
jgi:hypothetical protein